MDLLSRKSMSKKARERKRLIRILKREGVQSDPKSVKEWLRKAESRQVWLTELESRIISLYKRQKASARIIGGNARYGTAAFLHPGEWEPPTRSFIGSRLSYKGMDYEET